MDLLAKKSTWPSCSISLLITISLNWPSWSRLYLSRIRAMVNNVDYAQHDQNHRNVNMVNMFNKANMVFMINIVNSAKYAKWSHYYNLST